MSAKINHHALFSSPGDAASHHRNKLGKENHNPAPPLTPLGNNANTPKRDLFRTPTNRFKHEARTPLLGTPECFNQVEFETPKVKTPGRWSGLGVEHPIGIGEGDGFSVTVAVRVRPFSDREKKQKDVKCVVSMNGNETTVSNKLGHASAFCYDHCFWSFDRVGGQFASQENVYERLGRPLLDGAFEGYNTCLFAYGQTGSGKSYTIMGYNKELGIIPRFCRELFRRVDEGGQEERAKYTIEISFFEIYNEKIHDLLASSAESDKDPGKKRTTLKVREHPVLGPYVEGLSTFVANSYGDIHSWIELGNKQRATAATGMNDKSSRSHSVFTIVMTKRKSELIEGDKHTHNVTSKINLVDLAGSERCSTAQTTGDRLKEGANINRSLMTLSKVIAQLAENSVNRKKKFFIPYRDSVLTWLLKESLGGNSKTAMIATVSPSSLHIEETLSTLRYAKQARSIINLAKVNEDPKARLIRELRAEIERLRDQGFTTPTRGPHHPGGPAPQDAPQKDAAQDVHTQAIKESLAEIAELRRRLAKSERHVQEVEGSWKERLQESETRRVREVQEMEKSGVAFKFDNTLPNLVNLNEDPQLSEVLLYVLREGETRLGKPDERSGHQIQLGGALVADNHCLISNREGSVTVRPVRDAQTFVNGHLISRTHSLKHGDRLVIGDHYFRFNHPRQVQDRSKISDNSVGSVDFEFARNELVAAQSARLEAEVEEERLRNHREKIEGIQRAQEAAQEELDKQKRKYESQIQQLCIQLEQQIEQKETLDHERETTEKQILDLNIQNKVLEGQVSCTRRRLELEVKAAQQNLAETEAYQSHIFRELEREREKAEKEMEKMRLARERREKAKKVGAGELAKSRKSLLQLSMWLQEANNISKKLAKHTVFNRQDVSPGSRGSASDDLQSTIQVRVTNGRLGITTRWSLTKFEDRLIQMRELFKCSERGRSSSSDDDVFYNPNDDWEKDYQIDSPRVTPLKRCFKGSCTPSRLASLTNSSSGSLSRPGSSASIGSEQTKRCSSVTGSSGLPGLCRTFLKASRARAHGKETIADPLMEAMQRIQEASGAIQEVYSARNEAFVDSGDLSGTTSIDHMLMQATSSMHLLSNLIAVWDSNQPQASRHSDLPPDQSHAELLEQMSETCQKTAGHLMKLFQGCEGDIDAMIAEATTQITQCLVFLARLVGEASLQTGLDVVMFSDGGDRSGDATVDPELKQGFLNGADVLIDRTLQEALKALTSREADLQVTLGPDSHLPKVTDSALQHCLSLTTSAKILLNKCQDVQFELASVLDGRDKRPDTAYSQSYQRARRLVQQASDLGDMVCSVNRAVAPLATGADVDWDRLSLDVAGLLQTGSALAATASSCNLLPTPTGSECSYASVESSASSNTLVCRPNHLVGLAGQQLVQCLGRFSRFLVGGGGGGSDPDDSN